MAVGALTEVQVAQAVEPRTDTGHLVDTQGRVIVDPQTGRAHLPDAEGRIITAPQTGTSHLVNIGEGRDTNTTKTGQPWDVDIPGPKPTETLQPFDLDIPGPKDLTVQQTVTLPELGTAPAPFGQTGLERAPSAEADTRERVPGARNHHGRRYHGRKSPTGRLHRPGPEG